MRRLKCYAILISISFGWTVVSLGADTPERVKEAIRSRLAVLQNIIVEYNVSTTYTPPQKEVERVKTLSDAAKSNRTVTTIVSGSDKRHTIFSFLHRKAKYEKTFADRNYGGESRGLPKLEVQAYSGAAAELLQADTYGNNRGKITKRVGLPPADIEIGLGMRAFGQNHWVTDQLLKEMSVSLLDGNTAILEYVDPKSVKHKWMIDQGLGGAVKRYERILTRRNNKLNHVMTMEDFEKVDGLMLPRKMILRALNSPGEQPPILKEIIIEIIEYRLNDPQNVPGRYHIKWPEGTIVHDTVLETTYISDGTGTQIQRYTIRNDIDPEGTLLKPPIDANAITTKKSTNRALFIPTAQLALKKNEACILDLAHAELICVPYKDKLCREKIYRHLLNLGKGDIAWDGSLVTVRRAKALTVQKESHRPLDCIPGRWCSRDKLPDKAGMPYSLIVVTNEDMDYLVTIDKIQSDGIQITHRKLNADEAKRCYPAKEK